MCLISSKPVGLLMSTEVNAPLSAVVENCLSVSAASNSVPVASSCVPVKSEIVKLSVWLLVGVSCTSNAMSVKVKPGIEMVIPLKSSTGAELPVLSATARRLTTTLRGGKPWAYCRRAADGFAGQRMAQVDAEANGATDEELRALGPDEAPTGMLPPEDSEP
jgi:hypothetical protein